MILLFTSSHCTWCEVVRSMIEEQVDEMNLVIALYEIDIDSQVSIARTYGILEVPTIISGTQRLSGLPSFADLRSLIFQSVMGRISDIPIGTILTPLKPEKQFQESESSPIETYST
ncbi:MAG: hypothetical protein BAJATHORv1_20271 [Candidatus Thorarchaeota archaeon]|nr:MAG: hypothetical protein BAJATHORv1_20271 [Candidatus Thorarchaeota archaeon]